MIDRTIEHSARPLMRRRRVPSAIVTLVTVGMFAAACGGGSTTPSSTKSLGSAVMLGTLGPTPFVSTAPQTSIPFALGYWKKQHLDVTFQSLGSNATDAEALQLIASHPGTLYTAPVAPSSLMEAVLKGLPVIAVYVYMRQGLNSIFVLNNSPVHTMAQLDGKTIGTYAPPPGGPYDEAKFMIRSNGGNPSSVNIINIGFSPATIHELQNGTAAYVVTEDDFFTALGTKLRELPDSTFNQRFGFVYAVNTAQVAHNPNGVTALMKGIAEATAFTEANRTAALEVHWSQYPESKPVGASHATAVQEGLLSVLHRFDKYTVPSGQQYGLLPDQTARWNTMEQEAMLGGSISQLIPVQKLYTSKFITAINDFDISAIVKQAMSYKP